MVKVTPKVNPKKGIWCYPDVNWITHLKAWFCIIKRRQLVLGPGILMEHLGIWRQWEMQNEADGGRHERCSKVLEPLT